MQITKRRSCITRLKNSIKLKIFGRDQYNNNVIVNIIVKNCLKFLLLPLSELNFSSLSSVF